MSFQNRLAGWTKRFFLKERLEVFARFFVCAYFFNAAATGLEIWYKYYQPFPLLMAPMLPISLLVACGIQWKPRSLPVDVLSFAIFCVALADSGHIAWTQLSVWWNHNHFYINELMVKKFSLSVD